MTFITGSDNVGTETKFVTIIISLQIYTYCTCYFGEDTYICHANTGKCMCL